jgi:hypothetical protein
MKALRSIALGSCLLFAAAAAHAQGITLRANIPFNFAVGNQALPAGEYVVQPTGDDWAILTVRSSDSSKAASAITYASGGGNPAAKTVLVFHCVGQKYFLSQIQVEGDSLGRQLPKSRAEAELASNQHVANVVILAKAVTR